MDKLYQCPYDKATKCNLQDPCLDCETFSEYITTKKSSEEKCRRIKKWDSCPKEPSISSCKNYCGSWF